MDERITGQPAVKAEQNRRRLIALVNKNLQLEFHSHVYRQVKPDEYQVDDSDGGYLRN